MKLVVEELNLELENKEVILEVKTDETTIDIKEDVKVLVKSLNSKVTFNVKPYAKLELDVLDSKSSDITFNIQEEASVNFKYVSSKSTGSKVVVNLNGYKAAFFEKALVVNKNCDSDLFTYVYHKNKETQSDVSSYGVAIENSNIVFDTNGTIERGMSKSNCNQIAKGIIVSKKASIKSYPKLFIDEFDVKANHGAAIGKMSDDELFYLMSRGLSKEEAFKLIVSGIINPVVSSLWLDDVKEEVLKEIYKNI